MAASQETDLSKSLNELLGYGDCEHSVAQTKLILDVEAAFAKPLNQLADWEIGKIVVQKIGMPYILDLVMPKLAANPLFDGGYYPGDVLSNLVRAEPKIFDDRPSYRIDLADLYRRALERPWDERDAFCSSLGMIEDSGLN